MRMKPRYTFGIAVLVAALCGAQTAHAQPVVPEQVKSKFRDMGIYNPDTGRVWTVKDSITQPWTFDDNIPDSFVVMEVFDAETGDIDPSRSGLYLVDGRSPDNDSDVCFPCGTDMRIWTADLKDAAGNLTPDGFNELYITWTDEWGVEKGPLHAYTSSRMNATVFETEDPYPPAPDVPDGAGSYAIVVTQPQANGYFNYLGQGKRIDFTISGPVPDPGAQICVDVFHFGDVYNDPKTPRAVHCDTFANWGVPLGSGGAHAPNIGWCEMHLWEQGPPEWGLDPIISGAWFMRIRVSDGSTSHDNNQGHYFVVHQCPA